MPFYRLLYYYARFDSFSQQTKMVATNYLNKILINSVDDIVKPSTSCSFHQLLDKVITLNPSDMNIADLDRSQEMTDDGGSAVHWSKWLPAGAP